LVLVICYLPLFMFNRDLDVVVNNVYYNVNINNALYVNSNDGTHVQNAVGKYDVTRYQVHSCCKYVCKKWRFTQFLKAAQYE
jgi:hypothetical protein